MGREVRKVPANWKHPKSEIRDGYQPLYDEDFETASAEWKKELLEWEEKPESDCEYWEWNGGHLIENTTGQSGMIKNERIT